MRVYSGSSQAILWGIVQSIFGYSPARGGGEGVGDLGCYTGVTYNGGLSPKAHSYRLGLVTWGYQVRIPVELDIVIVVVHIRYSKLFHKESLKSFEIRLRVGHCPGFGLPSVAIFP